ncbi:MAG: ABC transporter permease [Desulfohalobiaceae bacterium]|nr:ABC transporter permease [Desulfohalobiaceae bacterium]
MLQLRKRPTPLGWSAPLVFVTAVVLSLAVSALLLRLQGQPAWEGLAVFFQSGFGSTWALEDTLNKAVPLFLCSLGVAVAFKLQIWNIGAEGQFALGAVGATWAALYFSFLPWFFLLPLMLLSATIAGGIWGLIPALLKLYMRANEIITTLMLNYIGILILEFLVYGSWKDRASFGFPMTPVFESGAVIARIGRTNLHYGLLLCLAIGLAMALVLAYTRFGYELKASGENPRAGRYAHIPYKKLVILVLVISGALAGWAGFVETSATLNRLQPSVMAGYGYTAIVVAWLARLNPLGIALFSFLLAGMLVGVEGMQLELQIPAAFGKIMEGLILLTVLSGQFFRNYRFARR